jgi:hypothetical protein
VVFQRIFPLLVLLVLAGACTPENNPPQTAVAGQAGAAAMPREIEKEVGPAYASPGLQALVARGFPAPTASMSSTSRWPMRMPCRRVTSS